MLSLPAKWINYPSALADCEYKPWQLDLAARVGLRVPETVVTNDPDQVRAFAAEVGELVVDPGLVESAQVNLKAVGHDPTLATGDGYAGLPEHGPYGRILATCAVTHVPPPWIRQLAEGGRIVVPIAGNASVPLLVLDKTAPDEVTGRFTADEAGFMPLRPEIDNPLGPGETTGFTGRGMAYEGTTTTDPRRVHEAIGGLVLFCQFHLPGLRRAYDPDPHDPDRHRATELIVHTAEAMARVALTPCSDGRWPVAQRGRYRVWDTVETALDLWDHLGAPDITRFGVTALDDVERQYVWLDDPEGPYSWPMPL